MIGILLSLLFPGLGQIYYGRTKLGLLLIALTLLPFLYPVTLIWSIVDIIRAQKQGAIPAFSGKDAAWVFVFLLVVVPLGAFVAYKGTMLVAKRASAFRSTTSSSRLHGNEIRRAILTYHQTQGTYPESIASLTVGRPLRRTWLTDPWGEPYVYAVKDDSSGFVLFSKGPDEKPATGDDIRFAGE